ncbi:cation/H(+) antiporter 18-like [Cucurbita pepo subsp. pepo]|uniref:cation/H(+) antiporter 18-like n=1 Tax=Cucurbita pepo subsp. pepo TaxID=3664 RepID=UPI000C9D3AEF|nr:cation/H(+) antiporter 18-like [Cucurbita pepo subsp. pepo]
MEVNMTVAINCPSEMKATSNGVFQGDNPLDFALPLAILQICLVVILTRVLGLLFRPLRQPRVVAEIVGGILLGPSAVGRSHEFLHAVFPERSLTMLDTLANLGLLFFLFLVGLELDPKSLRHTGKAAMGIALAGITLPFLLGIGTSFVLRSTISQGVHAPPFLIFMGVALSITAFPVLARILAELKLLNTNVGRMAMSAAAVNDVAAWIFLALAIALSGTGRSPLVSLWVFLFGFAFVLFCFFTLPPIFRWMSSRCSDGEPISELYICATLSIVLAAGFFTDLIGIHALFGAFVVGVLVPKDGPLAGALVDKVEGLVSGLFLPLYFVSSGLKTNIATIKGAQSWGLLVLVVFTACLGKVLGTIAVALFCKMPVQESIALGFLMNTKGLVELIVLNIGKDRKVLNDQTFAILVLMAIITTFITTPIVMAVYKPAKRKSKSEYINRTIEREDPNSELRILACFHSVTNIPSVLNLIEASRGAEGKEWVGRRVCVYAMHLMELTERSSAIFMVHRARKNQLPFWNKGGKADSDQIVVAFEDFGQLSRVSIRPMTAISPLSSIHEDVCNSAERKRAAIIILPFHKHQRYDGCLETTRGDFQWVNQKVLEQPPCSVGILVDRGFGGGSHISASNVSSTITIFFFGGSDDREALAYGRRMAEHPGITLNVIRFLPSPDMVVESIVVDINKYDTNDVSASIDERVLSELKMKKTEEKSIKYEERVVSNSCDAIDVMREFGRCHLILVGRMPEGRVVESFHLKSVECPELGPIGSLFTSPELLTSASLLVIQQFRGPLSSFSTSAMVLPEEVKA